MLWGRRSAINGEPDVGYSKHSKHVDCVIIPTTGASLIFCCRQRSRPLRTRRSNAHRWIVPGPVHRMWSLAKFGRPSASLATTSPSSTADLAGSSCSSCAMEGTARWNHGRCGSIGPARAQLVGLVAIAVELHQVLLLDLVKAAAGIWRRRSSLVANPHHDLSRRYCYARPMVSLGALARRKSWDRPPAYASTRRAPRGITTRHPRTRLCRTRCAGAPNRTGHGTARLPGSDPSHVDVAVYAHEGLAASPGSRPRVEDPAGLVLVRRRCRRCAWRPAWRSLPGCVGWNPSRATTPTGCASPFGCGSP